MASRISRLTFIGVGILVLASIAYRIFIPGDDPYRCRSLLETGRWIDPPDENGDRLPFKKWQPDGCLFHNYTSVEIQQCTANRPVLTSGDSTSRNLGFGIGRLLNRSQALEDNANFGKRHAAGNFTWNGVNVQALWNPYLRTVGQSEAENKVTTVWESLKEKLEPIGKAREGFTSHGGQGLPALVFFSSGAWYAKTEYPIEEQLDKYSTAVSNVSEILGKQKSNFIIDPMDPAEGVGDQVVLAPPAGPWYQGNDTELTKLKSGQGSYIVAFQDWLHKVDGDLNFPVLWAIPKLFVGQLKAARYPDNTGWHATEIIVETKANLLFNLRCNAKVDRLNGFPYKRTCCTDYGIKPLVQSSLVAVSIIYLLACLVWEICDFIASRLSSRWKVFNMNLAMFILALVMCYYADRTQIMAKGAKLGSYKDFGILCSVGALIALATIRRSQTLPLNHCTLVLETNQPFLGQRQIEEWKGWMLLVTLVSRWTDVQSPLTTALIRTFISAYLFLTGYEHTIFFMVRKDFYFKRAATVLLKLNLLSCSLAYFMNTNYMFYYLAPLVSFWFMVIYITMAIGHQTINGDIQLVLSKICISAVLIAVMQATPLTGWAFQVARILCGIRWNAEEWEARVSADILTVYFGMVMAIANLKSPMVLKPALKYSLAFVSIVTVCGYAHAYSTEQAFLGNYQTSPAHLSTIAIIAFIAVRNASPPLQNYHSKAMSWLGRCYLEAYSLQFHLFLAGDSYGVLLIDGLKGDGTLADRWRSLIIIVPLFFWTSSRTRSAIVNLVNIILGTTSRPETISAVSLENLDKDTGHRSGDETDEDVYDDDALLGGVGTDNYLDQMSTNNSKVTWPIKSILYSLQTRVACIILIMWLLNILSPAPTRVSTE